MFRNNHPQHFLSRLYARYLCADGASDLELNPSSLHVRELVKKLHAALHG